MANLDEGFIEAEEGVQLYFRVIGRGEGVLIPLVSWTEEFDVLAKGRRLIFYDPRSRGQSTAVERERISFQNDLHDLEAVRKHFALEKMSLIGWSYFGGVVGRYAMEFPERVERFVMVCGPPIRRLPHSDTINQIMAGRINAVAPGFLEELQATSSPEPEKLRRLWDLMKQVRSGRNGLRPMRGDPSRHANEQPENIFAVFRRGIETQGDWDWREDARRATSPALFVAGDADFLPFEAAREWSEYLPNAQVFKMSGVGHFPSLEDPDLFFRTVENFLRGHWPVV
jgi:proline iminopeptidase